MNVILDVHAIHVDIPLAFRTSWILVFFRTRDEKKQFLCGEVLQSLKYLIYFLDGIQRLFPTKKTTAIRATIRTKFNNPR